MNDINAISVKDLFWVRFKRDINFRFSGLPQDIHFTISNHPNSPDINLHISKNNGQILKPSIRIIQINRTLFNELTPRIAKAVACFMIKQVNIKWLKMKNPDLIFINTTEIAKTRFIKKKFPAVFESLYTTKKSKISINKDFATVLESLVETEYSWDKMQNHIEFSYRFLKGANFAILQKGESITLYQNIGGKWFVMNPKADLFSLLRCIVGEKLADHLVKYTMQSIEKLTHAVSYDDVADFNKPVTLIRKVAN